MRLFSFLFWRNFSLIGDFQVRICNKVASFRAKSFLFIRLRYSALISSFINEKEDFFFSFFFCGFYLDLNLFGPNFRWDLLY